MGRMMVVFEVYVAPGADPASILSAETARETKAQVMTMDEAKKVGFSGLPDPGDKEEDPDQCRDGDRRGEGVGKGKKPANHHERAKDDKHEREFHSGLLK